MIDLAIAEGVKPNFKASVTLREMGFHLGLVHRNKWGDPIGFYITVVTFLKGQGVPVGDNRFDSPLAPTLNTDIVSFYFVRSSSPAHKNAWYRNTLAKFLGYTVEELWPHLSLPTVAERTAYKKDMEARKAAGSDDTAAPQPQPLWRGLDQAKCAQDVNKEHSLLEDQSTLSAQPDNLPAPTAPWMGDLHRLFSASPADTSNAVLRKRVRELEAENVRLRSDAAKHARFEARFDSFYNGANERLAVVEAAIASTPSYHGFAAEMAAWPPIYEVPRAHPVMRFLKWLAA